MCMIFEERDRLLLSKVCAILKDKKEGYVLLECFNDHEIAMLRRELPVWTRGRVKFTSLYTVTSGDYLEVEK